MGNRFLGVAAGACNSATVVHMRELPDGRIAMVGTNSAGTDMLGKAKYKAAGGGYLLKIKPSELF